MKEIVNDGFAKVVKPYMDAQDKKSREIIAPVEVSPAEAAHSAGEQIIFNGILYDVIAPIAIDDALSISGAGANISAADNIETQINSVKNQIQSAEAQAAAQNKSTQEMIAPVEEDETDASRAYEIGEQLILDDILYDVTAPIEAGDALSTSGAGANISAADNIEAQIKATKSQIQTAAAQAAAQNKNTQEMIAPVEEDETDASRAYAIGDQLILDGVLYNVIDAIAQHGIITSEGAGANIEEADNVTDQLSSLNGALTNEIDKAYKTDDATITEVASDDLLPIYDTSATAKKKIAVNNLISGLVSNPNLLDNPWFTVNQRGFTSTNSTNVFTFMDRWRIAWNPDGATVSLANDILTIDNSANANNSCFINQRFESDDLVGKKCTVSVLLSDGTIYKGTNTFTTEGGALRRFITSASTGVTFGVYCEYPSGGNLQLVIQVEPLKKISIKAIKVELGSVSTLAMDTAPNYTTELLKCQRYYHKYATQSLRPSNQYDCVPEMRTTPTQSNIIIDGTTYYVNSADL